MSTRSLFPGLGSLNEPRSIAGTGPMDRQPIKPPDISLRQSPDGFLLVEMSADVFHDGLGHRHTTASITSQAKANSVAPIQNRVGIAMKPHTGANNAESVREVLGRLTGMVISDRVVETLRTIEPLLESWFLQDPSNVLQFIRDPGGSLHRAGISSDHEVAAVLDRLAALGVPSPRAVTSIPVFPITRTTFVRKGPR
jgi:hypothetical protein